MRGVDRISENNVDGDEKSTVHHPSGERHRSHGRLCSCVEKL
jgi:hypothetical protein